ncbi:energy transducer TonB [Telluria beijingensis]|uniref:energy transducer TonB n=1 Tax=Telluria beijingensis TaxID=3068633 RepID=UPI0027957BBD|nr:energy transducer TonB [Massilia sp. REN29]
MRFKERIPAPARQSGHHGTSVLAMGLATMVLAGCTQTAPVNPFAEMPDSVTTEPVVNFKSCRKPVYPAQALAAKAEGTVNLAFLVRADGTVREAVVRKTSGNASLDETARAALAKCRFQPGTVNGAPKEQWTELKYAWVPE